MDRILKLDSDGYVAGALQEHKRLVISLLDDEYLSGFFWQEPSAFRAKQSRKAAYNAQTWYIEQHWVSVHGRQGVRGREARWYGTPVAEDG